MDHEILFAFPRFAPTAGSSTPDFGRGAKFMLGAELKDSHAAADYIATIAGQLAEMAATQGWGTLVNILEIARLEAEQLREHSHEAVDGITESNGLSDDRLDTVNGYGED
jgi:hypothetical protein